MILIEGALFPPFGFVIAEMSSNSNADASFSQKDLLWPDLIEGARFPPSGFNMTEMFQTASPGVDTVF